MNKIILLVLLLAATLLSGCANEQIISETDDSTQGSCSSAPCPDPVSISDVNFITFGTMPINGGANNYNLLKQNADCYGLTGIMAVKPFENPYGQVSVGSVAVFPGELAGEGDNPKCSSPKWIGGYPTIEGSLEAPIKFTGDPTNHEKLISLVGGKAEYFIGFSVKWNEKDPAAGIRSCTCNPQWFDKGCTKGECNCALGCCNNKHWDVFVRQHVVPGVVNAP